MTADNQQSITNLIPRVSISLEIVREDDESVKVHLSGGVEESLRQLLHIVTCTHQAWCTPTMVVMNEIPLERRR